MIGIINRGNLPDFVQQEFEHLTARLREIFLVEHNEDGTHRTAEGLLNFVPVGAVNMWTTDTAPEGWLLCRGQQVSRLDYKGLFDVIGTTYGAGDGSTTFNVPDLQQRFPLGKAASGTGSTLAGTGGDIDHTHSTGNHVHTISGSSASSGSHTHSVSGSTANESSHTHDVDPGNDTTAGPSATTEVQAGTGVLVASGLHTHVFSHSNTTSAAGTAHSHGVGSLATGSDGAHTHGAGTLAADASGAGTSGTGNPPFIALNYIIFAGA